jgi:hypothetical protein
MTTKANPIPLTPALSQREREKLPQSSGDIHSRRFADDLEMILPLPLGEGRGEGDFADQVRTDILHQPLVPIPHIPHSALRIPHFSYGYQTNRY